MVYTLIKWIFSKQKQIFGSVMSCVINWCIHEFNKLQMPNIIFLCIFSLHNFSFSTDICKFRALILVFHLQRFCKISSR